MNNATHTELTEMSNKIRAAEAAGRSASTLNRLWRKYFAIETALKARDWS